MKLIYAILLLSGLLFTGYLYANDLSFDNISFSNYLINSLFIVLMSCLAFAGIVYLITQRRKSTAKDMMTIRQYYDLRSAR